MKISITQATALTGMSYRTIKKKIDGLTPVGKGQTKAFLYESKEVFPLLYAPRETQEGQGDGEKLTPRDQLALAQKEGQELKNAEMRKELIPVSQVKEVWARIITGAKTRFLALPDRLARILETIDSFDDRKAIIDEEIKTVLTSLAEDKE